MPNLSPDIVVFKRNLLSPEPEVIRALSVALVETVANYMPISKDTVRFMDPNAISVPVIGGNFIERMVNNAPQNTELAHLGYDKIADRIEARLARRPSFNEQVATKSLYHALEGGKPYRKVFGVRLAPSTINNERRAGSAVVARLGNRQPLNSGPKIHMGWLKFYTSCPEGIENALQAVADEHIPPGTALLFGRIRRVRQGDEASHLDLTTKPNAAPQ